jgi:sugar (pentulose or hexulose) kinase
LPSEWERASKWLTLPEYFLFRLSGVAMAEYTEASTTQLLDVHKRTWSEELARALHLDIKKFPDIAPAGTPLGKIRKELATDLRLANVQVIAPACHDTGAAVAGIPSPPENQAFISSGTWSLVGMVLPRPAVTDQSFEENFTNEGGVAGSIRFLRNVIGLWLLQECLREWKAQGLELTAADLAQQCADAPAIGPSFEADAKAFLAPGNMVARINAALRAQGFEEETDPKQIAAIIFRSLARQYAKAIREIQTIVGKPIERICVVGGGVKNETLNRMAAEVTGRPVVRGPSESTAVGNIAMQIAGLEKTKSLEQIQAISARLKFPSK